MANGESSVKLGVVIPLKSELVAKDWQLTCENLKRTINSIISQSAPGLSAVVVGHEKPSFLREYLEKFSDLYFVELKELSPPSKMLDIPKNQLLYEKDRCSKILKGIDFFRRNNFGIDYWFPLDADDLIHRDFHRNLQDIDQFDAVILNKGYIYYDNKGVLNKEDEFSAYCGSSAILSDKLLPEKIELTDSSYKEFIFGKIAHVHMESYLRSRGFKVFVPNDRLIAYCKGHGENISDEAASDMIYTKLRRKIRVLVKKVYFDEKIRAGFGLDLK